MHGFRVHVKLFYRIVSYRIVTAFQMGGRGVWMHSLLTQILNHNFVLRISSANLLSTVSLLRLQFSAM